MKPKITKIYLVFSETKNGKHYAHAQTIRAGEYIEDKGLAFYDENY